MVSARSNGIQEQKGQRSVNAKNVGIFISHNVRVSKVPMIVCKSVVKLW